MFDVKLDIAFGKYDRTRALAEGEVKLDGIDANFHTVQVVTEAFEGMARGKYDVSEFGMTYYLRTFQNGKSPFIALPVFPARVFRHSGIYINKASGIERPEDLNGKTIGELALYGHDAGIMPKGTLMDEHGFRPETCRWIIGHLEFPMKPVDYVARPHPANVSVTYDNSKSLGEMLEAGEIDALISADLPKCIVENSPRVARLFPDYDEVEQDYFRRTGIFPIMHTLAVRRDKLEKHPEIARALYDGFCAAKDVASRQLEMGRIFNNMALMLPWANRLFEKDRALMGADWWPYGVKANRKAIDAVLRYHYEQGITERQFSLEELFVADLLDT